MNDSFFHLSEDKRAAIINAAFRVFSQNGYKKSPMNEIAEEAGISKSLLFYYFKNKKELYLFLVKYSADVTRQEMIRQKCFEKDNFFDAFISGLKVKADMLRSYPELAMFELKAYYEKEPELRADIERLIGRYSGFEFQSKQIKLDPEQFIDGLDLEMMYRDIYLASEGYLWEKLYSGGLDPDIFEQDYLKMIAHWKKIYLRKGAEK